MTDRVIEIAILSQVLAYCQAHRRALALGALVSAAFLFCYAGVLMSLAGQWRSNDMYSYGFLIPVISGYLVWIRRKTLASLAAAPTPVAGWAVLGAGLMMQVAGKAGAVLVLQELSLIVTLIGGVLLLLGTGFLRVLWFPIAYLLFMVPVWDAVTDRLHYPFQRFSANLGVMLVQAVGIPVHQEGVYIQLPNITLEVARVCSGVNYLIAVFAVGIPLAYLFLQGWARRSALVGFAVTIAVLSNGLRVALIGVLSYYGLSGDLHGPFHVLQGLFVSVIGYGAIFGGLMVLSKTPSDLPVHSEGRKDPPPGPLPSRQRGSRARVAMVSAVLAVAGGYVSWYEPIPVPLKENLRDLPLVIGEWRGEGAVPGDSVFRKVGADREVFRTYRRPSGGTVHLYIGYFESQQQGRELADYRSGDLERDATPIEMDLGPGRTVVINQVLRGEGGRAKRSFFWYDLDGRIATNAFQVKSSAIWKALTSRKTNGAIVIVVADGNDRPGSGQVQIPEEEFIKDLLRLLPQYMRTQRA